MSELEPARSSCLTGLIMFALGGLCLFGLLPTIFDDTPIFGLSWGTRQSGSWVIAIGLVALAVVWAVVAYARRPPWWAPRADQSSGEEDAIAWWLGPALLAVLGAGVFGVERATAYGMNVWVAIGLLLVLLILSFVAAAALSGPRR